VSRDTDGGLKISGHSTGREVAGLYLDETASSLGVGIPFSIWDGVKVIGTAHIGRFISRMKCEARFSQVCYAIGSSSPTVP